MFITTTGCCEYIFLKNQFHKIKNLVLPLLTALIVIVEVIKKETKTIKELDWFFKDNSLQKNLDTFFVNCFKSFPLGSAQLVF